MKTAIIFLIVAITTLLPCGAKTYNIQSPSGNIKVEVQVTDSVRWSLFMDGEQLMGPSLIAMKVEGMRMLGTGTRVRRVSRRIENSRVLTPVYRKSEVINHYNQLSVELNDGLGIIFRVFDDGVAYRLKTSFREEITILNEIVNLVFPTHQKAWVPYIVPRPFDPYSTSFESTYDVLPLADITADSLIILPLLVDLGDNRKAVITEVDLESYPGLFLELNSQANGFRGRFARFPLEEVVGGHNNLQSVVTKRANFIARTTGAREFPWRAIALSDNDKQLLDHDIVARLASPNRAGDISWIKPGKVAWDWWNDLNIKGVDFRAGVNTATYKYYIDFASANGIEYVILDEGWSERGSLLDIKPYIDLDSIMRHAASRGVRIILWAGWLPLNRQMEQVMQKYGAMGVAGYKIDFMDRNDQPVVDFYYRVASMAAKYRKVILFHGSYQPTGLQFTYPNVVTFEGVFGLENVKWTDYLEMPLYNVTAPFIRGLAGPMDYTPGAMINANRHNWRAIFSKPMSQGTRCHQLAMYVVFESPISMMADSPTNYKREPLTTEFIASIPTVFDETVILSGVLGQHVAIARRHDNSWYVGAMTNWEAREIEISLSFLGDGKYRAVIFSDGINADRNASDYRKEELVVTRDTILKAKMAPGGGWAASFEPLEQAR